MTAAASPLLAPDEDAVALTPDDVRRPVLVGIFVIVALVLSFGVWASATEISGAVIASATVVVDSNVKKVQHPSGGIVGAIQVKEGDLVQAGQLLVRLDDTLTRANLQLITKQIDQVVGREARLTAELADEPKLKFPAGLTDRKNEPHVEAIIRTETAIFANNRSGRQARKAQLRERIAQLREELAGTQSRHTSKGIEQTLAQAELGGLETLDTKGLVSTPRLTAARRLVSQLEGDLGQTRASIAETRAKISETELQLIQIDEDQRAEIGKELRDQQAKEAELSERRIAAEDQLKRVEIRAPQRGRVHQLSVHTVGGVVAPSEPLMLIVPDAEQLILEAKIPPQEIDQVQAGQPANVRFTALNMRTTPEYAGRVAIVSADLVTETSTADRVSNPANAIRYYVARIHLEDPAALAADGVRLIPGMPAEVHIQTEERTVLSYLIRPMADQFSRAFRER